MVNVKKVAIFVGGMLETVSRVQEEAGDILADAKAINEARAAAAEQEVIADDAAESAAE